MSFIPNKKQEMAFERVAKAILDARACGLDFYGQGSSLVAFTSDAAKYIARTGVQTSTGCEPIPHIERGGLICDSGADDIPCFINKQDEQEHLNGITKRQKYKFGILINRES